jgi:drug/metabolite transporter (DMT)-like permease
LAVVEEKRAAALGWMALGAVLFSLMNFFARVASAHATWAMVGASRAVVGAFVAWGVARARGSRLVIGDRKGTWLRSVFGTASMMATFYALSSQTLPLGDTVSLLYLTPVFVAVLAPFVLRERTGKRVVLALALSISGALLILRPAALFGGAPSPGAALGAGGGPDASATALVAVLASLLSACAMMMLRRVGQRESAEAIALHFSLVAAGATAVVALADLRAPGVADLAFMLLAGVAGGFGQLAMTRAYSLGRAAHVGAIGYLSVVVSALFGALALHERPHALALAGMTLVVLGGLAVTVAGGGTRDVRDASGARGAGAAADAAPLRERGSSSV